MWGCVQASHVKRHRAEPTSSPAAPGRTGAVRRVRPRDTNLHRCRSSASQLYFNLVKSKSCSCRTASPGCDQTCLVCTSPQLPGSRGVGNEEHFFLLSLKSELCDVALPSGRFVGDGSGKRRSLVTQRAQESSRLARAEAALPSCCVVSRPCPPGPLFYAEISSPLHPLPQVYLFVSFQKKTS